MDLIVLLVIALATTVLFEATKQPWVAVLAWISWWLLSLQWMKEGSWHLSLLPFTIGLAYLLRVLMSAVKPSTLKKMLAGM